MKKVLIIIASVVVIIVIAVLAIVIMSKKDSRITNDDAEKDEKGIYLTIINNTNQIINEVHVTVGNGTEIEDMKQTNPDEKSFSIEIPEQYSEYDTFLITVIDRYDMKYQKEIKDVKKQGRTEVEIKEENYVEEKGDFFDKVDKFFNGD